MKRWMTALLALTLLALPLTGAVAAKVRTDIPEWTEETVQQFVTDYMSGDEAKLEELLGLYNLQVRRYMPPRTFNAFLSELWWMTGDFQRFGEYYVVDESLKQETKTHVLHLCMEKMDLDLFLTHEVEDNELTNVEFVPAKEQSWIVSDATEAPKAVDEPSTTDEPEVTNRPEATDAPENND